MKLVVEVKSLPTPLQAEALEATLCACNTAASWVSGVAFDRRTYRNFSLREHAYAEVKTRRAACDQEDVRRVCDFEGEPDGRPLWQAWVEAPPLGIGQAHWLRRSGAQSTAPAALTGLDADGTPRPAVCRNASASRQ
ncbi:hypothetical protein ABT403_23205 [Streptomyces sp. NPDC000075]|uniref:hypothetical protein n=1 Tax=Streptomyces TaxID=1883 RepID=UPI0031D60E61